METTRPAATDRIPVVHADILLVMKVFDELDKVALGSEVEDSALGRCQHSTRFIRVQRIYCPLYVTRLNREHHFARFGERCYDLHHPDFVHHRVKHG